MYILYRNSTMMLFEENLPTELDDADDPEFDPTSKYGVPYVKMQNMIL